MRLSLTRRGDYGVKIMALLAASPPGSMLRAADIAEQTGVPSGFVPTIVATLHRAGLVQCTPGRKGGCRLARSPEDVSVLDIVTALEGPLTESHCILDGRRCLDSPECALHERWSEAHEGLVGALSDVPLSALPRISLRQ